MIIVLKLVSDGYWSLSEPVNMPPTDTSIPDIRCVQRTARLVVTISRRQLTSVLHAEEQCQLSFGRVFGTRVTRNKYNVEIIRSSLCLRVSNTLWTVFTMQKIINANDGRRIIDDSPPVIRIAAQHSKLSANIMP